MDRERYLKTRKWVERYQYQFYVDGDILARTDIAVHNIILKPGTGVINVKQFRLPQLRLIDLSIQRIRSERGRFATITGCGPTFDLTFQCTDISGKKEDEFGGNNDRRLVTDYRALNAQTVTQDYPVPLVWELVDSLSDCKFFTCLDIKQAYQQIPKNPGHVP